VSFTFINLPELLNIIHFYSNSILENVLYLLLANLSLNQLLFLKINRVWPGYLNSSRCLSKVSKSTSSQRISVIFQILFAELLRDDCCLCLASCLKTGCLDSYTWSCYGIPISLIIYCIFSVYKVMTYGI
jgi:hypothetical protein